MAGVRIAKDKLDFVKLLTWDKDEAHGPFETMADVMVFASSLGIKRERRLEFTAAAADPIRLETFENRKYGDVLNLIALTGKGDATILARDEKSVDERIRIFEEYANGGLEILQEYLTSGANITQRLLLLLDNERRPGEEDLDLSTLLGMDEFSED